MEDIIETTCRDYSRNSGRNGIGDDRGVERLRDLMQSTLTFSRYGSHSV